VLIRAQIGRLTVALTFGSDNVGRSDVLRLLGFDSGSLTDILRGLHSSLGHLNFFRGKFISYNLINDLKCGRPSLLKINRRIKSLIKRAFDSSKDLKNLLGVNQLLK